MNMKKTITAFSILAIILLAGCKSTTNKMADSAAAKNVDADGFLVLGELDGTTTGGKVIMGRLTYNSRKVSIPAETKVPNTGYFKAVKTKSLLGTSEYIIQYDWTAGSDADAEKAEKLCQELKAKAEEAMKEEEAAKTEEKTEEKKEESTDGNKD